MSEHTVLLVGRSLLLAGVAASLRECTDLSVALAATWGQADALLADRTPHVVVADLADASDSRVLTLLFQIPHLVVLGLDSEHNLALLISGQEARALTMDRIKEIVLESEPRMNPPVT